MSRKKITNGHTWIVSDMLVSVDETILLDLKHLLMEAKQFVPDFLRVLESDITQFEDHGGKSLINWLHHQLSATPPIKYEKHISCTKNISDLFSAIC